MNAATATTTRRGGGADRVERFRPLVERIARKLVRRLPPTVALEDLEGFGWVGLLEALRRAPEGIPEEELWAFLSCRVRGAMLDHLRAVGPAGREVRNTARRLARAERTSIVTDRHREAARTLQEGQGAQAVPYTDRIVALWSLSSEACAPELRTMSTTVRDALRHLPGRLQQVLALRYRDDWDLLEIAEHLGVSSSRVSQLHTEALQHLRSSMRRATPHAADFAAAAAA